MKEPLDAVDHQRARIVRRLDHALQPQQGLTMPGDDRAEERRQRCPFDGLLLLDEPRADHVVPIRPAAEPDVAPAVRTEDEIVGSAKAEPAPDVGAACLVVEERCTEQLVRVDRAEADAADRRAGVERAKAILERLDCAGLGKVGLGDQAPVRDRCLAERHALVVEVTEAVHGVDGGDDRVETRRQAKPRVRHQAMEEGNGIGKAGRLHHDPARPVLFAPGQRPHRLHQIIARRAAEAAIGEEADVVCADGVGEDGIVDADLAEFVDDHRGPRHCRLPEQCGNQRGLAAAEEAGDDRYRDPFARRGVAGHGDASQNSDFAASV